MLTTQEALVSVATATGGAAADALRAFAPDDIGLGPVSVALPGRDPLAGVDLPAAVASATFADGGGAVLVMPVHVAARISAAVHGEPAGDPAGVDLAPAELDALEQAARKAMDAYAAAAGQALELELTVAELDVRVAQSARDVNIGFQGSTRATLAVVSIFDEPCRLVGIVPADLIMRIAADEAAGPADPALRDALSATLRDVPLRVWAEVGRARLRSAEAASLGDGAIVELDRAADDPVDVYVNGSRIGTGRLVCIDGKEWAVRLEEVFASAEADPAAA